MKYYGNEGVEFVPSRILKEFYNVNSNFGNTSYQNQIEIVDNMLDFVSNPNILENFNTHQFYNILNIL